MIDELIARLEAATGDDVQLFVLAYATIYDGDNPRFCSSARARRFMLMLDAEAYESAALTLVPDGCLWGAGNEDCTDRPWAWCLPSGRSWDDADNIYAATPALAIVIAALRAHGA